MTATKYNRQKLLGDNYYLLEQNEQNHEIDFFLLFTQNLDKTSIFFRCFANLNLIRANPEKIGHVIIKESKT